MPIDISRLIFEQILRIDPALLYRYATVQDQLLYLILIPHVILLLFLWSFGYWIAGLKHHPGIRTLLCIGAYIYIVWAGWYGSFLVPIILIWFPLLLVAAFLWFLIGWVIHPMRVAGVPGAISAIVARVAGKPGEARRLRAELVMYDKLLTDLKKRYDEAKEARERAVLAQQIATIKTLREKTALDLMTAERRGL